MWSTCRHFHVAVYGRVYICYLIFFFKQKTAYEVRISDWSSDVCSSDLRRTALAIVRQVGWSRVGAAFAHVLPGEPQRRSAAPRSEERRVGEECVSTCRSRWSP